MHRRAIIAVNRIYPCGGVPREQQRRGSERRWVMSTHKKKKNTAADTKFRLYFIRFFVFYIDFSRHTLKKTQNTQHKKKKKSVLPDRGSMYAMADETERRLPQTHTQVGIDLDNQDNGVVDTDYY